MKKILFAALMVFSIPSFASVINWQDDEYIQQFLKYNQIDQAINRDDDLYDEFYLNREVLQGYISAQVMAGNNFDLTGLDNSTKAIHALRQAVYDLDPAYLGDSEGWGFNPDAPLNILNRCAYLDCILTPSFNFTFARETYNRLGLSFDGAGSGSVTPGSGGEFGFDTHFAIAGFDTVILSILWIALAIASIFVLMRGSRMVLDFTKR